MLRLRGSKRLLCDGLSRRDWMYVGGLGFLGLTLEDLGRLQASAAEKAGRRPPSFGRAKSCILLLPYGSPSQQETFDPKPDAPPEVRGQFGAIKTSVPGVLIGEHLPRTARILDRVTVVRSLTHPYPVHGVAYVTSGIPDYSPALETRPQDPKLWPYIGSVVDYIQARTSTGEARIPRNMALPWKMNSRGGPQSSLVQTGPYAAFLGPAYDPVLTEFEGQASREICKIASGGVEHLVRDPYAGVEPDCRFRIAGCDLPPELSLDRLDSRRSLLAQFDAARRTLDSSPATRSFDRYRQMAYAAISSGKLSEALDVRREPAVAREDYGLTLFGQSCLAARRLVEAGGTFVTVFWDEFGFLNTDWDTHWENFPRLKNRLLPAFDVAYSGLIRDLDTRGLLDETLVVWMSEHGRSPRVQNVPGGGRDHWSRAYSIVMAGAGIGRGRVVGKSDRTGADVLEAPISPKDVLATILHLLGIDTDTLVPDRLGRPLPIAGTGIVRHELLA